MGLRMALGAAERDLTRLVVGESLVTTLVGLGIGLSGAWGLARLLRSSFEVVGELDPRTLALAAVVLTLATLVASVAPARRAGRGSPAASLREG
jgi:ABC-type antimicrobial peptide transport system permease subunit